MTQDNDITTLQFLEEIQQAFKSACSEGSGYDTRRIVNFFDNTASLQILDSEESESLNGSATPIATLWLQSVAKEEDMPTFTVRIGAHPYEKLQKMLVLVQDGKSMRNESSRLVKLLDTSIQKAREAAAAKEQEQPPAEVPQAAEEPTSRRSSVGDGSIRDRSSRRSRLRSREGDGDAS